MFVQLICILMRFVFDWKVHVLITALYSQIDGYTSQAHHLILLNLLKRIRRVADGAAVPSLDL
jgi:hypothetical protein